MHRYFVGLMVVGALWAAPADAQFLDGWDDVPITPPPTYQAPRYEEPYAPSWDSGPSPLEQSQGILDGMSAREDRIQDRLLETQRVWSEQQSRARCMGNWGVQTWKECD